VIEFDNVSNYPVVLRREDPCLVARSTYHEHILCITKDCVVKEDTKEHERQWDDLLSLLGRWDDRSDATQETFRRFRR